LPKGPSEIDPWKHPERAKDRQRYVLSQMVRFHHLKPEEAEKFARAPIRLVRQSAPAVGSAPEFVDEVKKVLTERFGAKRLPLLGTTVVTTCDSRIQKLAREAVEKGLVDLDARQGYRKPLAHLTGAQLRAHLKKLSKDFPTGPSMGKIVEGVVTELVVEGRTVGRAADEGPQPVPVKGRAPATPQRRTKELAPAPKAAAPTSKPADPGETPEAQERHAGDGAWVDLGIKKAWLPLPASLDRYNPKALTADKRFAVGDVIRVRVIEQSKERGTTLALELGPQAAVVVLDPKTREVKALVGGYGYRMGGFDRALQAHRQPGSSFKPFVYTTAFATEKWTPASVLVDGPQTYVSPGLAPWKPQNAEKEEFLGPVRLRVALAKSLNTVASQLVDVSRGGVDPAAVAVTAHDAGIESQLEANPSLALGTSVVTPLEMTNAYATFANGGRRTTTWMIKKVGNEDEPPPPPPVQAIKPELAYLITNMMTSVIEEGTAASARGKLKRPAAGKTGTTNLDKKRPDAWFVGYTPDLVTGVWVGFDDMRDLGHGEQGARAALPMWVEIMQGALKGVPPTPFTQPPGVIVQKIDPKTGMLAPPGAANAIDEVFLEGTAPTQIAPAAGEANPDNFITDQAQ
jgi:penicillin-binding protein 1A